MAKKERNLTIGQSFALGVAASFVSSVAVLVLFAKVEERNAQR